MPSPRQANILDPPGKTKSFVPGDVSDRRLGDSNERVTIMGAVVIGHIPLAFVSSGPWDEAAGRTTGTDIGCDPEAGWVRWLKALVVKA